MTFTCACLGCTCAGERITSLTPHLYPRAVASSRARTARAGGAGDIAKIVLRQIEVAWENPLLGRIIREADDIFAAPAEGFALVKALDSQQPSSKASLDTVFRLYCIEGLNAAQVARKCGCRRSLVFLRLEALRRKLGTHPEHFVNTQAISKPLKNPSLIRALAACFGRAPFTLRSRMRTKRI